MSTVETLLKRFPYIKEEAQPIAGQSVRVPREKIVEALTFLRDTYKLDMLIDLTCIDYLAWEERAERFDIIYNVFSSETKERVILKSAVPEKDATIDSACKVWPAANWYEREVWDMFGVRFNGHPNLKRILMYEEFKGHALRKDYPYNFRQPLVGPKN